MDEITTVAENSDEIIHISENGIQTIDHNDAHRTGFFRTCFNTMNALSGVGMLALPYALSSGGWISLILLFLLSSITYYTALLIRRCLDSDEKLMTYPDIAGRAFGCKGRAIVSVAFYLQCYLLATSILVMEGDNLHSFFPDIKYSIGRLVFGGRKSFIVVTGLVVLPTTWLNNMNLFSYISATGVLASLVILGSIVWVGAFDGTGFREKGVLINLKGIPTSVSLYAFCYGVHSLFPMLYNSMKSKKKFSKVMLLSFLFSIIFYISMAFMGYLMFGSRVESQVTLNLPRNQTSSKVASYTTVVIPAAKYALMIMPIANALENLLTTHPGRGLSTLIRTGVALTTIIVAVTVSFFSPLISLVGAFLDIAVSIIFPWVFFLKISETYRRFGFEMVFIWMIVLVGGLILMLGTYKAVHDIIQHLFHEKFNL